MVVVRPVHERERHLRPQVALHRSCLRCRLLRRLSPRLPLPLSRRHHIRVLRRRSQCFATGRLVDSDFLHHPDKVSQHELIEGQRINSLHRIHVFLVVRAHRFVLPLDLLQMSAVLFADLFFFGFRTVILHRVL